MTPGHHERLMQFVSAAFDIVAATDISELAARGDFTTTPALEVARVLEVRSDRERLCTRN